MSSFGTGILSYIYTSLCSPFHLSLKPEITALPKVCSFSYRSRNEEYADKILEVAPAPGIAGKVRRVKLSDKEETGKENTAL